MRSQRLARRSLFKMAGAVAATSFWSDETLEGAVQNVNKNSNPSQLKITDLRVATLRGAPMTDPIIRIDTNQGVYGLGEVRDGASARYALMLKSRILGENPCNIDKIFRKIKQFGADSRQAGGVCAIEMACWDLAGKVYNVPVYLR
jgi:L-alanine-DL-glutamate epimerase-like enolase superfamily enzyme